MGSEIPTAWFQSVNAILCVILAPIMGALWVKLANSKKGDLSIPTKMGIWFISNFIAGILSGYVAELTANLGELQVFAALGVVVILLGLLLISLRKKLTAMME